MMEWFSQILSIGWFVILLTAFFSFSIFVHELGHFLVARWCGLVIETFSIGFGPAIWKKTHKGITYKVCILPLGGYVALPQLDPSGMSRIQGEQPSGEGAAKAEGTTGAVELPAVAPWRKILVSVAGAVGNILFAIVLAWLVYWFGMPASPAERSSVVGYVSAESASHAAGLRRGDTVLSVNDRPVSKWTDVAMEVAFHDAVTLKVRTGAGDEQRYTVATDRGTLNERRLAGVDGLSLCMIGRVLAESPAEAAGIRVNDVILTLNGEPLYSVGHMTELVRGSVGKPVELGIRRGTGTDAQTLTVSVLPAVDPEDGVARIGVGFNESAVEAGTIIHPKPMEQISSHAKMIFRFLEALWTPKQAKAAAEGVGGPVAIIAYYWYVVQTSVMMAVWFTGFLNVNLAILNLLPIPVLDGGHICFSLYEMIRRRPMPARVVNVLVNGFAVLLIGLIVLISARDVGRFTPAGRLVRGLFDRGQPAAAVTNAAPGAAAATNAPAP